MIAGVAVAAILLAACGSSAPAKRPVPAHHHTTSTTSTSTSAVPSSTTTSSTTTTSLAATSGPPRCRSSVIVATVGPPGVATGAIGQVVTLRNTSGTACSLTGYPGLQMLDASGHPIATSVVRGTSTTVSAVPVRPVVLAAGASASFEVGYQDSTGYGNASCPTSSSVEVTPPNAYHYVVVSWKMTPYGGTAQHLACGQVTVSPVYPGTGRYQAG